jgi:hypothetical protein
LSQAKNNLEWSAKQRTAVTVVGGGTSAAGLWDGEPISPNNSGKNNDSLEIEPYDFPTKCKICKIICKTICKLIWANMQKNMHKDMHYMLAEYSMQNMQNDMQNDMQNMQYNMYH